MIREELTLHGVTWRLNIGRSIDPFVAKPHYTNRAKCFMHNFTELSELRYFEGCIPTKLVPDIAELMTEKGCGLGFGSTFNVTPGEVWLFLAYQLFMALHPMEGERLLGASWRSGVRGGGDGLLLHRVARFDACTVAAT